MPYTVRLDLFEGPLDLLLYLIRKEEIEVTDIPIKRITDQYMGYLDTMQALELDGAGEYVLMAATLLRIKSRMLLPRHGEDQDEDPRVDLVRQLQEYKMFKEVAARFDTLSSERRLLHNFVPDQPLDELRSSEEEVTLEVFDLLGALRDVMGRVADSEARHRVEMENVTIEEQAEMLKKRITASGRLLFRDLFDNATSKLHVIVAFMALLELMHTGELRAWQNGSFSEIWIESAAERAQAATA